jgi:hypothetical protein
MALMAPVEMAVEAPAAILMELPLLLIQVVAEVAEQAGHQDLVQPAALVL